jgi:hypothetical protein
MERAGSIQERQPTGWTVFAAVLLFIVLGLFAGGPSARWFAVFFVALNAVAQIVWFPAAPLWAFLIILLDVTIIYQLTVRWAE